MTNGCHLKGSGRKANMITILFIFHDSGCIFIQAFQNWSRNEKIYLGLSPTIFNDILLVNGAGGYCLRQDQYAPYWRKPYYHPALANVLLSPRIPTEMPRWAWMFYSQDAPLSYHNHPDYLSRRWIRGNSSCKMPHFWTVIFTHWQPDPDCDQVGVGGIPIIEQFHKKDSILKLWQFSKVCLLIRR